MTIDEAINDFEQVIFGAKMMKQTEVYKYHTQLVKWLKELKAYREDKHSCELCEYEHRAENQIPCADCKHNHNDYFECRSEE